MPSTAENEFHMEEGQTFLLPTDAIYRISDKLDNASDQSSVYSNEPQVAVAENEDNDAINMGRDEFCRRLLRFGFDINGLPLRDDLLFETFEEAADFKPSMEKLSFWQKCRGYQPRNTENSESTTAILDFYCSPTLMSVMLITHIALWDYFGGSTCLDINCTATDQINVLCEEYQVREVETIPGDRHRYLRLPMRWSLGRWITNRSFQPNMGLIPTCWLTTRTFYEENKRLFKRPTWYIGIADVTTAYDYLLEDRSSLRPGLFVVFSPIWLNIDPRDHRPFILLLVCCKTPKILDEMVDSVNSESKTTTALEDLRNRIKVISSRKKEDAVDKPAAGPTDAHDVKASASKSENGTSAVKGGSAGADKERREEEDSKFSQPPSSKGEKESDKGAEQREAVIQERAVEHAALPFCVKPYTIMRNGPGRYLLFGRQYETLYDLVYHLTTHSSPLPHRLNYGPARKQQVVFFASVPPPFRSPQRDVFAMTMNSEQWAARHFDQVTEPSLLSQAFSFISRSIFDPFKSSHVHFAESVLLDSAAVADARTYMRRFPRPKEQQLNSAAQVTEPTTTITEGATDTMKPTATYDGNPSTGSVPTDESVLKTNPGIEIDYTKLVYQEEDILGSGAFGAVFRGKMKASDNREVDVAIKKLKMVAPEADLRQPWISEIEILQIISHPNVARFYGFCYDETKEHAMLTFELMNIGSLSDFMKAHEYKISANEHVDFLIQIARGMGQLHALDPPIVHGDLAARNVLMCHHPTDNTRFKWLPPEVLHRREMSTKSDVWSYGITATEMYGVVDPYGMMSNEKVLPFLNDGHRMEKPSSMPSYIFDILLRCWRKQPVDRPTFTEIERELLPFYIEFETSHLELVSDRLAAERNEQENDGDDKYNDKPQNQ
uniref:Protein kinase domain-containing protein n=1 Tax=Ascaris lumbricoides TaxID=6252 RepID=A0A9J2PEC5_ASCLU